jgi:hypothetical protein
MRRLIEIGLLLAGLVSMAPVMATPFTITMQVDANNCVAEGAISCAGFTPSSFAVDYTLLDFQQTPFSTTDLGGGRTQQIRTGISTFSSSPTPFTSQLKSTFPVPEANLVKQFAVSQVIVRQDGVIQGSESFAQIALSDFGTHLDFNGPGSYTENLYYQTFEKSASVLNIPFSSLEPFTVPRLREWLAAIGPMRWYEQGFYSQVQGENQWEEKILTYEGTATYAVSSVPEPPQYLLMGLGLLMLISWKKWSGSRGFLVH